jgi:hypothetical protein
VSSRPSDIETLIHDVNSKCASLKDAALLLKKTSHKEARELLALMSEQARKLVQNIIDFEEGRRTSGNNNGDM